MSRSRPFANRTDWTLRSNKLSEDLERLRRDQIHLLDLTESNPTRCGFHYPENEIVGSLNQAKNLSYVPEPRGSLEAREAICSYYREKGEEVSPEQVFLTSSTSEAYNYLLRLLVRPGQSVLFPRPSYPLFSFLADLNDVRMETYPLKFGSRWSVDLKELENSVLSHTKAVCLVNPNNPTGSFIHDDELKAINALCVKHGIALIGDEVFADFCLDEKKPPVSLVANNGVLTFVLGGLSKTLGLPQMKLSWIIVNGPADLAEEADARLEIIADTYLSVNTPTQNALASWLSHREVIQKQISDRIRINYTFLKENSRKCDGCELYPSEGGWYAVLKINSHISEEQWALDFLNRDHVYVHPGYFFDFNEDTFIVLSLLPPVNTFEEGVNRILGRISARPGPLSQIH